MPASSTGKRRSALLRLVLRQGVVGGEAFEGRARTVAEPHSCIAVGARNGPHRFCVPMYVHRSVTVVMDLGLRSNPKLHRAQRRPIQTANRSTARVGGAGQSFTEDLVGSESMKF
jgi:hypothetical protein